MDQLYLTGTWEQALLAAVIDESRKLPDGAEVSVGRTALQKLLYFIKRRGVPMSYRFNIHSYGPFSSDILRDTEWLQADEVVEDRSKDAGRYSSYFPGPALQTLLEMHDSQLKRHLPVVREVVAQLAPLRPDRLELIATLDYLHRSEAAREGSGSLQTAVVDRFMGVKKDRFDRREVEAAYVSLARAGLISG